MQEPLLQLQSTINFIGMSEFSEEFTDHEGERGHDINDQVGSNSQEGAPLSVHRGCFNLPVLNTRFLVPQGVGLPF